MLIKILCWMKFTIYFAWFYNVYFLLLFICPFLLIYLFFLVYFHLCLLLLLNLVLLLLLFIHFLSLLICIINHLIYFCCIKHKFRYHFMIWYIFSKQIVIKNVYVLENGLFLIKKIGNLIFSIKSSLKVFLIFLYISINSEYNEMRFTFWCIFMRLYCWILVYQAVKLW